MVLKTKLEQIVDTSKVNVGDKVILYRAYYGIYEYKIGEVSAVGKVQITANNMKFRNGVEVGNVYSPCRIYYYNEDAGKEIIAEKHRLEVIRVLKTSNFNKLDINTLDSIMNIIVDFEKKNNVRITE